MAAAPVLPASPPPTPQPTPLSQVARIVDTFIAPSKIFTDLRRSAQWWLPFLLMLIAGWSLVYVAEQRIGTQRMMENDLQTRPKAEAQYENATPEQRATQVKVTGIVYYVAIPVFTLIIWLVMAGLQFGTLKVASNSDITYGKTLAVIAYAGLPMVVRHLLGIASVLAGVNPDGFTLNNPVASNPGYFMNPADHRFIYFIASQLDLFLIWTLVLTAIGFSTTGKVKSGTSFAVVFGWWAVITLTFAALFS
ncbi:MAG TPA: YIP1 family protein [Verrucomicrobiae bacterium]|nr:YIP1 family protein [Verrucomicrobiae bacterium]